MIRFALFASCMFVAATAARGEEDARQAASAPAGDKNPTAENGGKQETIDLADGKILLKAPADWQRKKPSVSFIEHEFSTPKADGDGEDGRVTVMGAGGGVKANVERWKSQFPKLTKSSEKEIKVNDLAVHIVDLTGTYRDQRGPMAPATSRDNYRMLGAIIVGDKLGSYYVKFYGPEKTVAAQAEAFQKMLEGIETK